MKKHSSLVVSRISEVKEHTKEQKLHKNLTSFFITPPEKSDAAVQTDEVESIKTEKFKTISKSINCIDTRNNFSEHNLNSVTIKIEPPSNDFNLEAENFIFRNEPFNDLIPKIQSVPKNLNPESRPVSNSLNIGIIRTPENSTPSLIPDSGFQSQSLTDENPIFEIRSDNRQQSFLDESGKSKLDDSQDSLFQTMEDMFCESDDSSDIMTLIEKHSSLKATVKSPEIVRNLENKFEPRGGQKRKNISNLTSSAASCVKSKKREEEDLVASSPVGFNELKGARYKKKVDEIWLVERVNQTSKLRKTMMEISLMDYRKYGRIKAKFFELFGESDAEETMPDYSPICVEDHLQACKERIAPWIVKHLTPFYKHKRISSRELFKTICRHATDMLIISDTFPEESSVENYMRDFFKNKKSIKTEADIYL
ncbi:uncharacterized protein LOC117173928 [Belonocnema kinseyi]|uniref:uncharacterized protein LOC117173928 n=1 Tax=Belonocnema kinseyi TaxID=2817044 RepID=UPI00143DAB16|nr:uncharacterized protein LOC117173928 [Belonocnema kinseyi]